MTMAIKFNRLNERFFATWRSALVVIAVLFVVCVGFFTISGVQNKPTEPIVIDDSNLSPAEVQMIRQSLASVGQVQFFSADLGRIYDEIAKLSWVESVDVNRDWYRGVTVFVTPRKAVANFGSKQMIDANGQVFVPVDSSVLRNPNLVNLYGHEADALLIMTQMNRINTWFEPLGIQVKDLNLTPRQTWVIRFDNNLRVIVDRENTEQKLYGLPKILSGHYKDKLNHIQSVDLRYKNGFVIAWKSQAPTGGNK